MSTDKCHNVVSAAIYSALSALDSACAEEFKRQYVEPSDLSIPSQIAAANRFWRYQLGITSSATITIRENLIDRCELQDWLRNFSGEVAPVIVALRLPRSVSSVA